MAVTKKSTDNNKKKSGAKKGSRELTASVVRTASPRSSASSRSAASRSGSRKSETARAKRPAREPRPLTEQEIKAKLDRTDEVVGIILIAVGLVMCILTYAKTGAALEKAVDILFGLLGVMQFILPPLLVIAGVLIIAMPNRQFGTGTMALCFLALFCISCVIHLGVCHPANYNFKDYITRAYELGRARSGGGFFASMPDYLFADLISRAGAIIVFIAAALVCLLFATKISIRSAGRKVIAKVDAMEDMRKARIINETVGDGSDESRRRRRLRGAENGGEAEAAAELMIGGDGSSSLSEAVKKRREKRRHAKSEPDENELVISGAHPANGQELDLIPSSGKIPTGKKAPVFTGVPDPDTGAEIPEAPDFPEIDPFETIDIVPEDNITGEIPGMEKPAESEEKAPDKADAEGGAEEVEAAVMNEAIPMQVYQRPPLTLLRLPDHSEAIANDSPTEKAKLLLETLASFNINARLINISVGPVITRFEIQPAQGVRVNRITGLSNDIALALAAPRVRIEAPIPGKAAIGIEIPNKDTAMVRLREVLDTREFSVSSSPLTFALGKDIAGKPVYANLEKMPHMLIAGATGSGKSVCINSIILSTIYKSTPDEVRMILIDPKVVELSIFAPVPHLYCPVVTDPKKAAGVLKWACNEMDNRYSKMSRFNARDLARFNSLQEDPAERMPRLMIIIDELADLMIVSAKDVEESIARLAQLGRAAGIHLIVATQRPSVDVITGLIKTNIPSRIAFAVASAVDSRVILDMGGAEKLLGHGDMLFHPNGAAKPIRAQGAFVSDEEVEQVMQFFVDHRVEVPQNTSVLDSIPDLTAPTGQGNGKQEDDLLPDAVRIVMESGSASISMIQRRLRVGYARAARLVDIMEQMKIVSGFDGSKPRNVLIDEAGYRELFGSGGDA